MSTITKDNRCPNCGAALKEGVLSLGETGWGLFLGGLAFPHLFFTTESGERTSVMKWKSKDRDGYYCEECGFCIIMPEDERE